MYILKKFPGVISGHPVTKLILYTTEIRDYSTMCASDLHKLNS